MKQALKNIIFSVLLPRSGLSDTGSVLMYHSIGSGPAFFAVSPREFDSQLAYLAQAGLSVVTLSELVVRMKRGEMGKCVALTFDDGYKDNFTEAFPILKRHGMRATFFLATGFIGRQFQDSKGNLSDMMSEAEIVEMMNEGMEFMPHTVNHIELDSISIEKAVEEIEGSRIDVERFGIAAPILAYPRGKYTLELVDYLESHGWSAAVTVKEGLVRKRDNLFEIKRNSVDRTTTLKQFKGKVSGAVEKYESIKTWLRR